MEQRKTQTFTLTIPSSILKAIHIAQKAENHILLEGLELLISKELGIGDGQVLITRDKLAVQGNIYSTNVMPLDVKVVKYIS